jgi:undecaprenyl-diphosphatase
MPLYQVVILAIVQGLTEFLPVSSTAHLYLAPWLFGWEDPGLAFDIALHIGTLAAVLIYFFRDWVQVIGQGLGISIGSDEDLKKNRMLLWLVVAATIPVGVFGLAFNKQAEGAWRNPYVIGTMMILVAILMLVAERVSKRNRKLGEINAVDAGVIGLSQALAIVPGTSRSGITITAGLFRDLDRQAAARFSFLLSTPAIAAAALKALYDLQKHGGLAPDARMPFFIGIVISGVVGCVVIAFFLKYLRNHSMNFFAWYRIIFGIMVFALAFSRR